MTENSRFGFIDRLTEKPTKPNPRAIMDALRGLVEPPLLADQQKVTSQVGRDIRKLAQQLPHAQRRVIGQALGTKSLQEVSDALFGLMEGYNQTRRTVAMKTADQKIEREFRDNPHGFTKIHGRKE